MADARLEAIARACRVQIIRMLTHAGSGHPGGSLNASSIKPLDEEMLGRSAAKTGRVVTVEDHSIAGGLGGAVAEWLSEVHPTPLKRIGTTVFGESGDPRGLYAKFGFDAAGIARTVAKFMGR